MPSAFAREIRGGKVHDSAYAGLRPDRNLVKDMPSQLVRDVHKGVGKSTEFAGKSTKFAEAYECVYTVEERPFEGRVKRVESARAL